MQKLVAMILSGAGGFFLLQTGHSEAAIAIFTAIGVYAVGEANGKKLERKNSKGRIHITSEFTKEELIEMGKR